MPQFNIQSHHQIARITPGNRKGRCPKDGYVRGCGLQFGNIAQLCQQDPDFLSAYRLAKPRTALGDQSLINLFMLIAFYLPKIPAGHILEFGSWRGGSALFMAYLAFRFLPGIQVYAFDTFQGMPATDAAIDMHQAGDFSEANVEEIRVSAAAAGLTNLHCIAGRFEDTAAEMLRQIQRASLVHIDCDIYSGVQVAYDACKPHMVPGGYIAFDDPLTASCLGALEAVEELLVQRDGLHAEQVFPHMIFRYPPLPNS